MILAHLSALWDERDDRYSTSRVKPTDRSIEAAIRGRKSEADQIQHHGDRDLALARLAMWRGGSS